MTKCDLDIVPKDPLEHKSKKRKRSPPPPVWPIPDFQPLQIDPITRGHPKPKPSGIQRDDALGHWSLVFTDDIRELLLKYTNAAGAWAVENRSQPHERPWYSAIQREMDAYYACLIFMGIHNSPSIVHYWQRTPLGGWRHEEVAERISKLRFEQIDRFFRIHSLKPGRNVFDKVQELSDRLRANFKAVWCMGTHLTVDESIQGFQGRASETVNIPSKQTPIGFKIWALANEAFLIDWMFHENGDGPWDLDEVWTDEQFEINLTKTAAVVPDLVAQLCAHELPFDSPKHIVWMDNLFTSARLMTTLRNENIGAAGTVRMGKTQRENNEEKAITKIGHTTKEQNRGLDSRLRGLRSKHEGQIPWGTQYCCLSQDKQSVQFGWQDARIVLFMSTVHNGKQWVIRRRRRPAKTSTNSKTTRKPFGNRVEKEMKIPKWVDEYNHNMNAVDRFDQSKAECELKRLCYRTWKPLWNFLFQASIINAYLLTFRGPEDGEKPPFASQREFRQRLWEQLFERSERVDGRRGRAKPPYPEIPREEHQYKRLKVQGNCSECMANMRKSTSIRRPLRERSTNIRPPRPRWGCGLCNLNLCEGICFKNHLKQVIGSS